MGFHLPLTSKEEPDDTKGRNYNEYSIRDCGGKPKLEAFKSGIVEVLYHGDLCIAYNMGEYKMGFLEDLHTADNRCNKHKNQHWPHHGHGNPCDLLPRCTAVNLGGFMDLLWNRINPRSKEDNVKAKFRHIIAMAMAIRANIGSCEK